MSDAWSLSARRAWIEIETRSSVSQTVDVALRKESVDRNSSTIIYIMVFVKSLSARRAWIEIVVEYKKAKEKARSLSARRAWIEMAELAKRGEELKGRSPQGERG